MMKNLLKMQFIVMLVMTYSWLYATDWNVTKHMFRYHKDIDPTVSADLTVNMATVCYHDTLFNFVNYHDGLGYSFLVVRKIFHSGKMPNFTWDYEKSDVKLWLSSTEWYSMTESEWQPAPVVFRDSLLVFISVPNDQQNMSKGHYITYLHYKDNKAKWSTWGPDPINIPSSAHGMAAVVLDNKLCLITHDNDSYVMINWTKDLKTWHRYITDVKISRTTKEYDQISAVTANFKLGSEKKSKLVFAWLSDSDHPYSAEYYFSNDSTLKQIRKIKMNKQDDDEYTSVALATGTISCPSDCPDGCVQDTSSKSVCIQAFLKRKVQDNNHIYHRIKRFQLQESDTIWKKIENNLVPQNSPHHYWASREIPLTTATLSLPQDDSIRQFICLVYRGFDNVKYPLNIAWAETNTLVKIDSLTTTLQINSPKYNQYIGYIEGPPPYHVNKPTIPNSPYLNQNFNENISSLDLTLVNGSDTSTNMGFGIKCTTKAKNSWLDASISHAMGKKFGTENTITTTYGMTCDAEEHPMGKYIVFKPNIIRYHYSVKDVQNKVFDNAYYFTLTDPSIDEELVELADGLDPSNPETYLNQIRHKKFSQWTDSRYPYRNISWSGARTHAEVEVDSKSTVTTTTASSISVGLDGEFGNFFNVGFEIEASFDWEMETTTTKGSGIKAISHLNPAVDSTDVTVLKYDINWIKHNTKLGNLNWWLHDGAQDQNTWCVAYQVTEVDYKNGKKVFGIPDPSNPYPIGVMPGENAPDETAILSGNVYEGPESSYNGFSLSQNYPNPFKENTKIKYQIGKDDSQNATGSLGIPTKLFVTSMTGNLVEMLVDEFKSPGNYTVNWNTSNMQPGIYFYTLQSGNYRNVKKLILLK